MARLINDTGVLGDTTVTVSTMTTKGNFEELVSLDTIIDAIHIKQDELKITGRTAEEAFGTVEGSLSALKAAFSNWKVGLGDENADMSGLTDTLLGTFQTAADNVLPVVEQIGESLTQVFSDITGIDLTPVTAVFDGLKTSLTDIGAAFAEGGITGALEEIVSQIEQLTGLDLSGVTETFGNLSETFADIGAAFAEGGLSGGFEALVGQIESLTGLDLSGVTETFRKLSEAFAEIGSAFESGGVADGLSEIVETIGGAAGIDVSGLVDGIHGIAEAIRNAAQGFAAGDPVGAINMLVDTFAQATGIDLSGFVDGVWEVLDTIREFAPELAVSVQEIFEQVRDFITVFAEYLASIWPVISPIIMALLESLGDWIRTITETVMQVVLNLMDAVKGAVDIIIGVFGAIAAVFKGDFEAAAEAVKLAWGGVVDFFGGIANAILDTFSGLAGAMADIGRNMWEGLKSGLSNMVDGVKGIAGQVSDKFKSVLGIHSPSRVFAEYGRYMAQGMELGWNSEADSIRRTMADGLVMHGKVDFAQSAIGKASAATIGGIMASGGGSGGTQTINLVVDGRTLAQVVFDPLNGIIRQKGVTLGA